MSGNTMDNLCGLLKGETGVEIYETSSSITGSLLSPVKVRVHYQLINGYNNLHENNEYKHYLPLYIVLSLSLFKFKHSELAEFIHILYTAIHKTLSYAILVYLHGVDATVYVNVTRINYVK